MMPSLADLIEQYIKKLIQESEDRVVEIQRNELAEKLRCVPSQINYVLATRFTLEHGYLIESRRGGGGYIRIIKIADQDREAFYQRIFEAIGDAVSESKAREIIKALYEAGSITEREKRLLTIAVDRKVLQVPLPYRDELRALLLKSMIAGVLNAEEGN
ncbi:MULTISPECIES: CtsR family transcriptional regulator [Carboxydothermus]|nr:CtsR family transcriptional regulator [Carboxydothermus ferrireducens]NYE57907.1 transcriptional regulator CtsR [Carboxydothermus ferrireducens DSM 11255]